MQFATHFFYFGGSGGGGEDLSPRLRVDR